MLATRKRPVAGYLLKQSAKEDRPRRKKEEVGRFKKLYFTVDREVGLLNYFSAQGDVAAGVPARGSLSLAGVEFVEELARERPSPNLMQKKDKEDRSRWQWPFVIHTWSQGTHLFLAQTSEARDTWIISLEEAVTEAKVRERRERTQSHRPVETRERSESQVQADFLDILVFDSYVNRLRRNEADPGPVPTPQQHAGPTSPVTPPRTPSVPAANGGPSSPDDANALLSHVSVQAPASPVSWRKEELRKPSSSSREIRGMKKIGTRERIQNTDAPKRSGTTSIASSSPSVRTKLGNGEVVVVPSKLGVRKSASAEGITGIEALASKGDDGPGHKSGGEGNSPRSKVSDVNATPPRSGPRTLHTRKLRAYRTLERRREEDGRSDSSTCSIGNASFRLSLHRRNLSAETSANESEAAPSEAAGQEPQRDEEDTGDAKKAGEDETADNHAEASEQRGNACLPPGLGEDSSEFFSQIQAMQRRLSVVYRRMVTLEDDLLDGASMGSEKRTLPDRKSSLSSQADVVLNEEDKHTVRGDQEMLQAVVRREVLCRCMHMLVDNPTDHDVMFFVSADRQRAIHGHRAIIRARSSFFDKLFDQATAAGLDPKGPYVIPESTHEAFLAVLSFLYSAKLELNGGNVMPIYKTAAMLQVGEMEGACLQLAAREGIDLPPYPTTTPYHVAKKQSVLDIFKNVNFDEAHLSALGRCTEPQEQPAGCTDEAEREESPHATN